MAGGAGAAWAAGKKVDEAVLLGTRLIPDMLPFSRQVQLAARFAEQSAARLAGVEVPANGVESKVTAAQLAANLDPKPAPKKK